MPVAAVADEEHDHRPQAFDVRAVDDGASITRGSQKAGPHKDGEVRRQRVVRGADGLRNNAGGDADGFVLHQEPEDCEPRRLRERGQGGNRMRLAEPRATK